MVHNLIAYQRYNHEKLKLAPSKQNKLVRLQLIYQHVFVHLLNSNDHHVVRSDLTDRGDKVFYLFKLSNYSTCHRYLKLDCLKSSKFSQTFKIDQLTIDVIWHSIRVPISNRLF